MRKIFSLISLLTFATIAAAAKDAPPSQPMAMMKWYNDHLDKVLKKKGAETETPLSKEDTETLRSLQRELFDYNELSKRALAGHWDKLTKAQQAEFVKTFSEMIEKNYAHQLRSNVEYKVGYKSERIDDGEATVSTTVKVGTRGKPTEAEIEYKLHRVGGRWMVYDVITDDVSTVRNYKQQFNKVITNEGFDGLMKKLRKRIDDLDKQSSANAASDSGAKEAKN